MLNFIKYIIVLFALITVQASAATSSKETFDVADYKGKVVYLDFWASWCSPCRQSFPFMNELNTKFKDKGLVVISINVDKDPEKAAQFLEATPASFKVIYDQAGDLASAYKLKAMPTSYLFDRDGTLVGSHLGFKKKDITELTSTVEALLAK